MPSRDRSREQVSGIVHRSPWGEGDLSAEAPGAKADQSVPNTLSSTGIWFGVASAALRSTDATSD